MSELFLTDQWKVIKADGTVEAFAPPIAMPSDLVPGEFVNMPYMGKPQWFVFSDKQRFWDGNTWRVSGTIQAFDPGSMTTDEIYAMRRTTLGREGWIA